MTLKELPGRPDGKESLLSGGYPIVECIENQDNPADGTATFMLKIDTDGKDGPDHGPVGLAQQIPDQLVKNGQITF
ncbi:MAG: hypothetical protein NC112_09510 [Oxalobacter formigenes]|nr:hypothetical protein [Oxalobacter formigenes]